ncbi:uncharacterized protein LOC116417831 [Nasonia vitripennis]|uniref:MADF domain-containing protein n=1 Tax=Nasonia vitripennis TaxID=7425 RepID=A0A7M7QPE4_NASVI|nr:uncharacterized protein LOC116417831 [Nasonia vitripennis]
MTSIEKIIIRFYAANTFMFNDTEEKYYLINEKDKVLSNIRVALKNELSVDMSEAQIKNKYRSLRDVFVKANKLIELKKDLAFFQKCIYQRMFFLRPYICSNKKNNSFKL